MQTTSLLVVMIWGANGGKKMNGPFESAKMNDYFASLNPLVQQSVLQCGVEPKTLAELESLAGKMNDSHKSVQ